MIWIGKPIQKPVADCRVEARQLFPHGWHVHNHDTAVEFVSASYFLLWRSGQ
jgi:hypothetical protein